MEVVIRLCKKQSGDRTDERKTGVGRKEAASIAQVRTRMYLR